MKGKIKTIDELVDIIANLKKSGKKIVLCHGTFDLLHPGHIKHLKAAKNEGDVLIVSITADAFIRKGPGRPIFNQDLRAETVASLESVDYVAISNEPSSVEAITKIKPDVYATGSEYRDRKPEPWHKFPKEKEAIKSVGGRIYFTDEVIFSSTNLINQYLNPYPEEAQEFLMRFREKYKSTDIIERFKALKKLKVLVFGETIIDEYCYCQGLGKTPKDNIIATKYLWQEVFAGGVLAAANHIAGFCDDVHLVTCLGRQNDYEDFILHHLKPNIKTRFFYHNKAPTIVKRRFVDPNFLTKMFEIAYLNDSLPMSLEQVIFRYLEQNIRNYDLVLATDFGHGLINIDMANLLAEARFLAVNTQTNSANTGFNLITKYPKADYICLDEPEIRLACHNKYSNLENLTRRMAQRLKCSKMAITRGHLGSLTYSEEFCHIPTFATKVVDRVGAGDAYLSITAPCVAMNYPMDMVGFIGNAVGALKVQIVANKESVEPIPLFKFITTLLK